MRSNCHLGIVASADGGGRGGRADHGRHGLGLGLVDLHVFLQGVDELLAQVVRLDRLLGDLAQGDDRVLVAVAVDGERRSRRDQAGAVGGEQNELEAVVDLVDAILDGHASHGRLLFRLKGNGMRSFTLARPRGARAPERAPVDTRGRRCQSRARPGAGWRR